MADQTKADLGEVSGEGEIARYGRAFTEWMRRYIEEPERFESEFPTDDAGARSYGERSAEYFWELMSEVSRG